MTASAAEAWPGRAVIDHARLAGNLALLRSKAPGALQMAVVKADAYGHGLLPVALTALGAGADWLGVAQMAEALRLRAGLDAAGVARESAPILTWIAAPGADWRRAIEADLDVSVSWTWALAEVCAAAREAGRRARIHVKIDTGMSRGGSTPEDLPALASAVRIASEAGLVEVVGVWSHFSRADDLTQEGLASTAEHLRIFEEGIATLAAAGVRPRIRHIGATAAILWHPEAHYDMVRAGIGMYGLSPDPATATAEQLGLHPVMRLEAPLTSVKVVAADRAVSYGGTWHTPSHRWLGLVPLGYADGVLRSASNRAEVTVHTASGLRRSPLVGRVCMDQFVVDLGEAADSRTAGAARSGTVVAEVGDRAVLFGDPSDGCASADEWAAACGTIGYELLVRVGERVPRAHVNAPASVGQWETPRDGRD